jgi:hypothetical protein
VRRGIRGFRLVGRRPDGVPVNLRASFCEVSPTPAETREPLGFDKDEVLASEQKQVSFGLTPIDRSPRLVEALHPVAFDRPSPEVRHEKVVCLRM